MIGARNGFRPSLHEALTGGKMTVRSVNYRCLCWHVILTWIFKALHFCLPLETESPSCSVFFIFSMQPSRSRIFKVTPLKVLNSDGMSPTYGRSVKMTTSGSWQDSRHSVVEDRCREIADGRRAAVAAHRGI